MFVFSWIQAACLNQKHWKSKAKPYRPMQYDYQTNYSNYLILKDESV